MLSWLKEKFTGWLTEEVNASEVPICDFDRLSRALRPADVILVEGATRLSGFIKNITQSPWTHSALYIGRICEMGDTVLRQHVQRHYQGSSDEPLIIEGLIGQGIIVEPLSKYRGVNMRVCRPRGLSSEDASRVLWFAAHHLGVQYDLRQLFDLARWMSPRGWLPRRLGSTLFEIDANLYERTICSTLIAAAFTAVRFPIMPVVRCSDDGVLRFYPRNTRLCAPRDFDYSPYFDSLKFPVIALDDVGSYHHLPWDQRGTVCNDERECLMTESIRDPVLPYYMQGDMKDGSIARPALVRCHARARRRFRKHKVVLGVTKT